MIATLMLVAPACASGVPPQAVPTPVASAAPAAPPPASSQPESSAPAPATVAIPDTPAGHVLQAWLDAFNSGDPARIEAYVTKYKAPMPTDGMIQFRQQTGGFDLLAAQSTERLRIVYRVREKASPTVAVGTLSVTDTDPPTIDRDELLAVGMSPGDVDVKVDAAARSRVIDGIVAKLNEFYVFPDVAKMMETALRTHQKNGDYDAIGDGYDFASLHRAPA